MYHKAAECAVSTKGKTSQALSASKFAFLPLLFPSVEREFSHTGVKLNLILLDQLENYSAYEIR